MDEEVPTDWPKRCSQSAWTHEESAGSGESGVREQHRHNQAIMSPILKGQFSRRANSDTVCRLLVLARAVDRA